MNAPNGYFRKVIRIRAVDSPNVRAGLEMEKLGLKPTDVEVVPGVLKYSEYVRRRLTWDKVRQVVGLDAEFYKGAENLYFPAEWLNFSARLRPTAKRKCRGIGIDPGEGVSKTTQTAVDEHGILEIQSILTPDTTQIVGEAIGFMNKWNCPPEQVCFDRGGGGKQHADRMRYMGYDVRTVAFGESMAPMPKLGRSGIEERTDQREERIYTNRRAAMYGDLSAWLDPSTPTNNLFPPGWENIGDGEVDLGPFKGFHIPFDDGDPIIESLRKQLAVIPKLYDGEGRIFLPPKNRKPGARNASNLKSLVEMIGHSPDEADSVVLALYAMTHPAEGNRIGSLF